MSIRKHATSEYKYVRGWYKKDGTIRWTVSMRGVGGEAFDSEREAAIAADKSLIKKGKEPVNILIRKRFEYGAF